MEKKIARQVARELALCNSAFRVYGTPGTLYLDSTLEREGCGQILNPFLSIEFSVPLAVSQYLAGEKCLYFTSVDFQVLNADVRRKDLVVYNSFLSIAL